MALTLRSTKGAELTFTEMDANFSGLADGSLIESTALAAKTFTSLALSAALTVGGTLGVTGAASFASTVTAGGQFLAADGSAAAPGVAFSGDVNTGTYRVGADTLGFAAGGTRVMSMIATGAFVDVDALTIRDRDGGDAGVILTSESGNNTLALRNGDNAQTFRVYRTYTDGSNYERGRFSVDTGGVRLMSEAAGTGTVRPMIIGVSGSNQIEFHTQSTQRWVISTSGHLTGASGMNLNVGGDTTLGDGPGDSLTINAGTWTYGNNWTATRAAGELPTGTTNLTAYAATFSGHSGGGSGVRAYRISATASGANAMSFIDAMRAEITHSGSGTISSASVHSSSITVGSGATVTTGAVYQVTAPSVSGTLTTFAPFRVLSSAAGFAHFYGLLVEDQTGATGTTQGVRLLLSSGTGKHNVYASGTAPNYFAGQIQAGDGSASAPSYSFANDTDTGLYYASTGINLAIGGGAQLRINTAELKLKNTHLLSWANGDPASTTNDLALARDGAGILALRNGTNAQAFRVYNTFTDGSNHEYGTIRFVSNQFQIGTTKSGTGTARDLTLFTDGTNRWLVGATDGHFKPNATNTYDIGTSAATARTGYFGTSVVTPTVSGGSGTLSFSSTGGTMFVMAHVPTAVNYWQSNGSATTVSISLGAKGTDTNINAIVFSKGTGVVRLMSHESASEHFRAGSVANAVNYLQASGNVTGSRPTLSAQGADTNIGMILATKGTGTFAVMTDGTKPQFAVSHTENAVNYLQGTGGAAGSHPSLTVQGSDTNVSLLLSSKGAEHIRFFTNNLASLQFRVEHTASAVNYLSATGGATGNPARINATGSDTNIDILLNPKGSGVLQFGTHAALGAETVSGYITIKDSGGTERKLAVVS